MLLKPRAFLLLTAQTTAPKYLLVVIGGYLTMVNNNNIITLGQRQKLSSESASKVHRQLAQPRLPWSCCLRVHQGPSEALELSAQIPPGREQHPTFARASEMQPRSRR